MDFSQFPDGYGIYRIPYSASGQQTARIDIDEFENIYPLEEEATIAELTLSQNERQIQLLTWENGTYYLTVIDIEKKSALQKLALIDCPANVGIGRFYSGENFIAIYTNDRKWIVLESSEDGMFRSVFTVDASSPDLSEQLYRNVLYYAWDGKRLAIAAQNNYFDGNDICGFQLIVYDAAGLQYAGQFRSSLGTANDLPYSLLCRPEHDALCLSFSDVQESSSPDRPQPIFP